MVVQFDPSFDTWSRYCVACARSQSMRTRVMDTGLPKSSTRNWSSEKALLQRVFSSWSIAAAADRSPRSEPLAVATTGVSAVPLSAATASARARPVSSGVAMSPEALLPPPHPASNSAMASGARASAFGRGAGVRVWFIRLSSG